MPHTKLDVNIASGNDAMTGGDAPIDEREPIVRQAVADALREIADKIQAGGAGDGRIRDANGNTVGDWFLSIDVED